MDISLSSPISNDINWQSLVYDNTNKIHDRTTKMIEVYRLDKALIGMFYEESQLYVRMENI